MAILILNRIPHGAVPYEEWLAPLNEELVLLTENPRQQVLQTKGMLISNHLVTGITTLRWNYVR
jgi:hypothetical protein